MVEPLANIRTQLDGFTSPVQQKAFGMFLDEDHFASHLRRMRAAYSEKRAALLEELEPLRACGWWWASNPAGMHVVARHAVGEHVRSIAASVPLALALLSSYRSQKQADDGLMLRYGALDVQSIRAGARTLVAEALRRRPITKRNSLISVDPPSCAARDAAIVTYRAIQKMARANRRQRTRPNKLRLKSKAGLD